MKNILSPSLLAVDFAHIADHVQTVEKSGAHWLHLDVMDGSFVPNISFGPPVIQSIRGITDLTFDVHLMIEDPIRYIDAFKKAGADLLTFHVEAAPDIPAMIAAVKAAGLKCGISVNPGTPIERVYPYISDVDMVLVMSVEPGFGGQKFMPIALEKIAQLKDAVKDTRPDLLIEVDGGINSENVSRVLSAGANVIVAGSAVFSGDIAANVKTFLDLLNEDK